MTLAPPAAYSPASAAGSAIGAMSPLLGLARLTSAMTLTPWCAVSAASPFLADGTRMARSFTTSRGTSASRMATSSLTPSRMLWSTLTSASLTLCGASDRTRDEVLVLTTGAPDGNLRAFWDVRDRCRQPGARTSRPGRLRSPQ